jgi:hypothetical protein
VTGRRLGVALALLPIAWAPAAGAASLTLAEREREEALRVGQRSIISETFGQEWRVASGNGESVSVITPFHRIALAARNAAFKNEPLKPQDQERMLGDLKEKLMFRVDLRGAREDFARHFSPRLVVGDREIEPSIVQNERTALRQEDGRYLARCTYWFPAKDVTGTSRVLLVIKNEPNGNDVARFDIDLARMR